MNYLIKESDLNEAKHKNLKSKCKTLLNKHRGQSDQRKKMTSKLSTSSAKDLVRANFRRSDFDKLVKEIKKVMGNSVGFWKELPFTLCDQPNPEFQEKNFGWKAPLINDQCWNGRDNGPYRSDIVQDGLENWVKNPEMESHNARIAEPLILKEQSGKLLKITIPNS